MGWAQSEPSLRLVGQHAAPVPLGETAIVAWLLAAAGLDIPEGILTLSCTRMAMDDAGRLHGHDPLVHWLPKAGHVVVVGERNAQQQLCLVKVEPSQYMPLNSIDRMPAAALTLDGVAPLACATVEGLGELGLLPYLALLRAIQISGALAHVLELCVEYANDRVQFGKPISKFQAIQQMIADLAGQTAAAQVAARYAARQADAGNAAYGAAVAKSLTGRAATRAASIAHQVFGAIGVTDEHSLHYYTRRLWQWRADAGSEHQWSEYLGRAALDDSGEALWLRISGNTAARQPASG